MGTTVLPTLDALVKMDDWNYYGDRWCPQDAGTGVLTLDTSGSIRILETLTDYIRDQKRQTDEG